MNKDFRIHRTNNGWLLYPLKDEYVCPISEYRVAKNIDEILKILKELMEEK